MAEVVLKNVKLYIKGTEFSNNLSQVNLNLSVDLQDRTGFGSSGRQRLAGLKDVDVSGNGFWDAGDTSGLSSTDYPDPTLFARVGSTNEVWSILPDGTSDGSLGYSFRTVSAEYAPGAAIGDILSFTFAASGDGGTILRGKVLNNGTMSSGSPNGNPVNIGAVTSSEDAFIALHNMAFSSSGAGGNVEIQTDASSGFATPSTMLTITFNSSDDFKAAQMVSTDNAGTTGDTWWRAVYSADTTGDTASVLINAGKK